jgi:hypothetical protein
LADAILPLHLFVNDAKHAGTVCNVYCRALAIKRIIPQCPHTGDPDFGGQVILTRALVAQCLSDELLSPLRGG